MIGGLAQLAHRDTCRGLKRHYWLGSREGPTGADWTVRVYRCAYCGVMRPRADQLTCAEHRAWLKWWNRMHH